MRMTGENDWGAAAERGLERQRGEEQRYDERFAAAPPRHTTPPLLRACVVRCVEVCVHACAQIGDQRGWKRESKRRERESAAPAECLRRSPAVSAPPACSLTTLSLSFSLCVRLRARVCRTFAVMGSAGHHDAAPAAPAAPAIAPNLPTQRAALPAATAAGLIYLGATSGERSVSSLPCPSRS